MRCPFSSSVSLSQCIGIPLRAGDDTSARMTISERRSQNLGDVIELESVSTLHDPDQEDVQEKIWKEQHKWYKTQNTIHVCVYGYPTLTSSLFMFKSRIVSQGARHQQQSDWLLNYRTLYENHMKKIIETSNSYETIIYDNSKTEEYEKKKTSVPFNYHLFFSLIPKKDFDLDFRMTKVEITWWRS